MTEKTIVAKDTLDARKAAFLVQTASKFESKLEVSVLNRKINAKSIMGTMAIGIIEGQDVTIIAEGKDEEQAANELCEVLA